MPTKFRRCPAKINLSLRVLGRRPDGYHELDSVFLPLALCDELVLTVVPQRRSVISCRCAGHPDLDGEENLAARAARAYLDAAGLTARVTIHLRKNIWQAAGLGGGSSDAAAVLSELHRWAAREVDLEAVALGLGADVPFFLDPRPARVRGIGERLGPVEVPALDVVLVNPGLPLSTAKVFGAYDDHDHDHGDDHDHDHGDDHDHDHVCVHDHEVVVGNDLEDVARRMEPEIGAMKEALLEYGALAACMTGSGPTVFGLFEDEEAALVAEEGIRDKTGFLALATRTLPPP